MARTLVWVHSRLRRTDFRPAPTRIFFFRAHWSRQPTGQLKRTRPLTSFSTRSWSRDLPTRSRSWSRDSPNIYCDSSFEFLKFTSRAYWYRLLCYKHQSTSQLTFNRQFFLHIATALFTTYVYCDTSLSLMDPAFVGGSGVCGIAEFCAFTC